MRAHARACAHVYVCMCVHMRVRAPALERIGCNVREVRQDDGGAGRRRHIELWPHHVRRHSSVEQHRHHCPHQVSVLRQRRLCVHACLRACVRVLCVRACVRACVHASVCLCVRVGYVCGCSSAYGVERGGPGACSRACGRVYGHTAVRMCVHVCIRACLCERKQHAVSIVLSADRRLAMARARWRQCRNEP